MPISWTAEVPTGTRRAVLHPRARRIPLNVIKTIRNPPPRGSQGKVLALAMQPHADSPVPATRLSLPFPAPGTLARGCPDQPVMPLPQDVGTGSACGLLPHRRPVAPSGLRVSPSSGATACCGLGDALIEARLRPCGS